jgi:hypothetical protein
MSSLDNIVPLLQGRWTPHTSASPPIVPLPGIQAETLSHLQSHWSGFLTAEMRQILQQTCGLSDTPLGPVDFTGRWYAEEPLCIFRPCLTLAVDSQGRRWIAEVGKTRGLPGPVWCVVPSPRVALFVDRSLGDFLVRLHGNVRKGTASAWLSNVASRARRLWAARYMRAMAMPVAVDRLREIRGWLARLPVNAWIYDLRAPAISRGLPYGVAPDPSHLFRCGRLPVFAVLCAQGSVTGLSDDPGVEPGLTTTFESRPHERKLSALS